MKLSVSAYRAHASAHKKILSSSYQTHYGSTAPSQSSSHTSSGLFSVSVLRLHISDESLHLLLGLDGKQYVKRKLFEETSRKIR